MRPGADRGGLLLVAAGLAGLTILVRAVPWTHQIVASRGVVAAVSGPLLLAVAWRRPDLVGRLRRDAHTTALLVGTVVVAGGLSLWSLVQQPLPQAVAVGAWGLCATVVALAAGASTPRSRRWLAWGTVAVVAGLGAVVVVSLSGISTVEVWALHREAAGRLGQGLNPWRGLTVVNPNVPGTLITGYPYPPPALLAYAGAQLVAGDPRWAGWLAWAIATGLLAGLARGRRGAVVLVVLVAGTPGWFIVLRNAWTEPLSLALAVAGLALFDRRPNTSAVLLGLMAVSKQYLGLALIVLAMAPIADRWRRLGVAGSVAIATWLVGSLLGPGQLQATIGFHLAQPARSDGASLYGALSQVAAVGWPGWLAPLAGVVVAVWLGRQATTAADVAWALAGALTATFLLASRAFPNYWLLVLGLVITAAILHRDGTREAGCGRGLGDSGVRPGSHRSSAGWRLDPATGSERGTEA